MCLSDKSNDLRRCDGIQKEAFPTNNKRQTIEQHGTILRRQVVKNEN